MKKEEKIEVMFESILGELEQIAKSIGTKKLEDDIEAAVIEDSTPDKVFDLLDSISKRISYMKLNVERLAIIDSRIEEINRILKHPEYAQKKQSEAFHYFWFFPDLKGWLSLINRGKVAWISVVLLILSMGVNYYMGRDYNFLKDQNSKYKYLKLSNDHVSLNKLDSLWNIESYREYILSYVKKAELELEAEIPEPTQQIKGK